MADILPLMAFDWRYAPPLAMALAALVAAGMALVRRRPSTHEPDPLERANPRNCPGLPPSAQPRRSIAERRQQGRWHSRAIKLIVSNPSETESYGESFVMDRSLNGIGIMGTREFAPRTRLLIRPVVDGDKAVGAQIEVRTCKWVNDNWVWGCKFTTTPSWSVGMHLG